MPETPPRNETGAREGVMTACRMRRRKFATTGAIKMISPFKCESA